MRSKGPWTLWQSPDGTISLEEGAGMHAIEVVPREVAIELGNRAALAESKAKTSERHAMHANDQASKWHRRARELSGLSRDRDRLRQALRDVGWRLWGKPSPHALAQARRRVHEALVESGKERGRAS